MERTDGELAADFARTNSQAAFEEIVNRQSRLVYATCLRALGNHQDAEDATQAVFIVLARKIKAGSIRAGTSLSAWMYRTAIWAARDHRKMRERRRRREREAGCMNAAQESSGSSKQDAVLAVLDDALAALPRVQREAIVLRHLRGLSLADAASEMGCPEFTLRTRVRRGIAELRRKLQRRGVALTSLALLGLLEEQARVLLPERLSSVLRRAPFGHGATTHAATLASVISRGMLWPRVFMGAVAGIAALALVVPILSQFELDAPSDPPVAKGNLEIPRAEIPRGVPIPVAGASQPLHVPVEPDNDGRHLNDRRIWRVIGDLPIRTTSRQLRISMRNDRRDTWRIGGLMHHRAWHLADGPVRVRFTTKSADDRRRFLMGVCTPMYGLEAGHDESLLLDQALVAAGRYSDGTVEVELPSRSTNGSLTPVPLAMRTIEFVFARSEVRRIVDGRVVARRVHREPWEIVFVGFRAGARGNSEALSFTLSDVHIEQLPPEEQIVEEF